MNVIERRDYFMALSVFKCLHGMAPLCLSDCITMNDEVVIRDTRAEKVLFILKADNPLFDCICDTGTVSVITHCRWLLFTLI